MKQGRKGYHFDGAVLVSDTHPHLGITDAPWDEPTLYTVIHRPTGKAIGNYYTRDYAFTQLEALTVVAGLACTDPGPETLAQAKVVIEDTWGTYGKPVKRKKGAIQAVPRVELEAVYRPGFTPSAAVRAKDRVLGSVMGKAMAGQGVDPEEWSDALEDAFRAAWEEEFMVRVPGLLSEEIPERPKKRAPVRLQDGTLCSYAGFVESKEKLDAIGDRLLSLAETMLELAEGHAVWDREDRREWRETLVQFSRLVCEGWHEWTAAVAHFCASTREERDRAIFELGFLGSDKSGYRELGTKTFLRHPEVLRAAQVRHDIKGV